MWLEDIGQAQTGLHSTPGGLASGTSQGFRPCFPLLPPDDQFQTCPSPVPQACFPWGFQLEASHGV